MSVTRAALTTLTRQCMNAVGSNQWSDAELQTWLGLASWQEWANLLNMNNQYYMQAITVTQDSNGQFNVSDLTTGSGDTAKYFYRVLTIAQPSTPIGQIQFFYKEVRYKLFPNPQPNTSLPYVWYRYGSKLQILPVSSGQQMTVTVNYRPPRVDQLSADNITVDFPDGYESLLAWRATELALNKGGSENPAAMIARQMAADIREPMLDDLGRQSTNPIVADAFDSPDDWGALG